jgi:DNA repair exonuclease SbcCD nuclease subunit
MKNKNKPYKILHLNDLHLGLVVEGVDQTPHFEQIMIDFVNYGKKLKAEGYDVILIFGGDIFDDNNPSEELVGVVIRIMCLIKAAGLLAYYNVGNHEACHNPERVSALSFIRDAKDAFPDIKLIDDITMISKGDCVEGKLFFTFLPHISKALIKSKNLSVSPQEYIDNKCEKIVKNTEGELGINLVFSHLNVKGVHAGSEANLLKRSDVFLPNVLTQDIYLGMKPTIIQSHIHNRSQERNIHIVGSPVFCSANETGEKGFAEITVGKQIDQPFTIEYVPTNPPQFLVVEVDLREDVNLDFLKHKDVEKIMSMDEEKTYVIKFDVTVSAEGNNHNWDLIQKTIQQKFKHSIIKQIVPRIISDKVIRNSKQKVGLPAQEAVKVFIKKNWAKDKDKANAIYKYSKKYLSAEYQKKV